MRRTVFISYYHGDQEAVNKFIRDFSDVFIPKAVGIKDGDFVFNSDNPQYIMRRIREEKLQDSTVTIVLIGRCTHSRRYVDWEIKASLQQGLIYHIWERKVLHQKDYWIIYNETARKIIKIMQDIIHIRHRKVNCENGLKMRIRLERVEHR